MRAEALGRDKRAFEMHPKDHCADRLLTTAGRAPLAFTLRSHRLGDNCVATLDRSERRGDYGRQPCGGAFVREAMREAQKIINSGRHDVDAISAIDLKIDK